MAVKFNKGDVAEGILASAMTARFMSKTKRITEQDVIAIIKKLGKPKNGFKGSTSLSTFSSPNENTRKIMHQATQISCPLSRQR